MTARVAVFASGGGSNLQAILDHFAALGPDAAGQVVLVLSDRAQSGTLERARNAGIPAVHMLAASIEKDMLPLLREYRIDLIALAGFLKLLPADVVRAYPERILNVHPALLPKFGGLGMYGSRVHAAVLAANEKESGASIHFVDEIYDHGRVIAQAIVPVEPNDDVASLAARVLAAEHKLFPAVLQRVCRTI